MKALLWTTGGVLALLAAVVAVRTATVAPAARAPAATDLLVVDADAIAARLGGALRIPTITQHARERVDWTQWPRFHAYLAATFPRVHAALTVETVAQHSLLYTWAGTDPTLPPILLLAHQDVVPVEPNTESSWTHPPFGGVIADGAIWGRGALDDKASLMAQLEAVEALLATGFAPRRSVYFAFGHDEEIGGDAGARAIAALLERRAVRAAWSLDEGGALTRGVVAGIDRPVASIMTAEKGYVSLRLSARDAGGHSSQPPPVTAIGRLARAIAALERRPMPARLAPPVTEMLDRLAPEMRGARRIAVANRWLFGPLLRREMGRGRVTNALVRTTTAATVFHAGIKDNLLPVEAQAVVNFRVLPGDTVAAVEAHVRATIADPEVAVTREEFLSEPSPVSSAAGPGFALLERTINEVFPEAVVAPGLVIGATDSRHYRAVREEGYQFMPVTLTPPDLARIHGADERITIADQARAVQFYARLLRHAAGS